MTDYTLTDVAQNELLDYAKYTITNRALPHMIDSLKPSQRFFLYSCLKNARRDYKKVSALAGIVSEYGYNHGETSVAGTGQLMAAEWANNVCLVDGRGSFGTRQVQEAGAARYVFAKTSDNFDKYFKDMDLCPEHDDPEHDPPAHYLPVLPLVLVNGSKGIATGFATNILPRSVDQVTQVITDLLKTGKTNVELDVCFPDFTGTTRYDPKDERHICEGIWALNGRVLMISEIPYGFDREGYLKVLDDLESGGFIANYDDQTSDGGFKFEVKLRMQAAKWTDKEIVRRFKLAKPYTENLTVIGPNDELKEYNDPIDLIKDFVDYRLSVLAKRIALRIRENDELLRWLMVKMEFIEAVLDDKIVFKGKGRVEVEEQISENTTALDTDMKRLLALNILSLTQEMVDELLEEIEEVEKELEYWKATTPKDQFLEDIKAL